MPHVESAGVGAGARAGTAGETGPEERSAGGPAGGGFAGAVGAEWAKLWSLRTPYVCLLVGVLLTSVFTYYYGSIARINDKPVQPLGNAPVSSVMLGQFTVIVMAMVMVTSEYGTGSIRSSLLWVPVRHRVQLAKALVAAGVAFAAGIAFSVLGMAVARIPFGGHASFDAAQAAGQTLATGAYCALVAVLTVGTAFAVRTAAGTLSAVFVLVSVLPSICTGLGGPFLLAVNDYLPQTSGGHFMLGAAGAPYPRTVGLLITVAWTVAAHLAGRLVLRRRDA
ncbi:ABC transporter permease [Streptomyces sp. NPDC054904]|uniref:ABC transporter permease n=1 Tax=Streptomyces sp. Isolate_45 TaxID=2950111 RepID=UPI002481E25D|nr:ABC transporter permease [Streptomyces sp. Isolate_45]MDA5281688.1 ABC transporter permease [Streptomyces sp. Isolate_45]